ncbi:hypothetical protein [Clostridium nigeriense]|uniref:hypothetical protein n=1 Tax=Clostridium nigeriense TaxID=1805470 RepID=UPI000831D9ED|nr:hypothetical protein [Clostridium nigeriense]
MKILSFLKLKKKQKEEFNNKLDTNINTLNIVYGQILYCRNGERVIFVGLYGDIIKVKYNGKIHERPISCIGTKLFINNPICDSNNENKICYEDYTIPDSYHDDYISPCSNELIEYGQYIENYISDEELMYIKEHEETPLERMHRIDREREERARDNYNKKYRTLY